MNGDQKKENNEGTHCGDEKLQATTNKVVNDKAAENIAKTGIFDILDDMPSEMKKNYRTFIEMGSISRSILSPLHSKINEGHIDKIIEMGDKESERMYKDTQHSRKFMLIYILIGVSLFVFLTLFLVGNDKELFKEIIKLFIAFAGGMGAGYGFKTYKDNK